MIPSPRTPTGMAVGLGGRGGFLPYSRRMQGWMSEPVRADFLSALLCLRCLPPSVFTQSVPFLCLSLPHPHFSEVSGRERPLFPLCTKALHQKSLRSSPHLDTEGCIRICQRRRPTRLSLSTESEFIEQ